MNWIRASTYHLVSDDGRYTIARVRVGEMARYELWQARFGDVPARMLSTHASADDAKAAFEMREAA